MITLIQTRQGCAILEKQPRYNVMLNGKFFDQLYFNMRGYVGYLPTPDGHKLNIGERGISAFRKEIAQLNKEFKNASIQS